MVVASLDEFHQSFLPGRTGVFRDVVLDTMGAIFVQALLLRYWTRRKKNGARLSERRTKLNELPAD